MHVHCPHWLKSTGLLSLNAFCRPCKSTTGEIGTKGGLQVGCGDLIWHPLSVHICLGIVVEYWSFVDACTRHSYSNYTICVFFLLYLSFYHHPPHPCTPSANPLIIIHWPKINEFHEKIIKNWQKPAIIYLSG